MERSGADFTYHLLTMVLDLKLQPSTFHVHLHAWKPSPQCYVSSFLCISC